MNRFVIIVTAIAASLFVGPLRAQSVAVNGGFSAAEQLDGWFVDPNDPNLSAEWNALDANGEPGSGSALVGNTSPGASNGVIISQCIRVQGGADYRVGGMVRVPSGPAQSLDDRASIAVRWASDTACSVNLGGSVGTAATVHAFDTWIQRGPTTRTAPANAQSVQLRALATKTEAGGSYFVQFDDIFLIPQDLIFAQGFDN